MFSFCFNKNKLNCRIYFQSKDLITKAEDATNLINEKKN